MSALQSSAARALPVRPHERALPTTASKPKLKLITAPSTERPIAGVVYLCITLLVCSVLAVLVMNTELADGAYQRSALTKQLSAEVLTTEQLTERLADVSTPENLAVKAERLGMKQMVNPEVLHIDSSKINRDTTSN
ncbi:hypothetical protein [Timonella senegalensis]|jgi:hypothetical protein|uniref:hypothetical protein n=1 Tax=Timonella senegalensis TaxID=1465825 RepID=UPI0002F14EF4|nr:hypothetical protein [Timonella senegalensis]